MYPPHLSFDSVSLLNIVQLSVCGHSPPLFSVLFIMLLLRKVRSMTNIRCSPPTNLVQYQPLFRSFCKFPSDILSRSSHNLASIYYWFYDICFTPLIVSYTCKSTHSPIAYIRPSSLTPAPQWKFCPMVFVQEASHSW